MIQTMLVISAILLILYGLGFVFIPNTLLSFYNVQLELDGIVLTQLLGAAFMGFGLLNWQTWKSIKGAENRYILNANIIHFFVGFLALLIGRINGAGNELIWLNIFLYLIFALGFASTLFKNNK